MAIKYDNVIIFGPTGAVGSVAALEASKRGATVWLAMRDTGKKIETITEEQEQSGSFRRVRADLTDPESVTKAIQQSGAKAAYVYLVFHPAGLKPALQAMKDAGIDYIVFLSSFTIQREFPIRDIGPKQLIPFMHAQAEVALEDLGIAHAALRAGAFASNPFRMFMDTTKTPNELYVFEKGQYVMDNIVPADIGRVAGTVLVNRPSTKLNEIIFLFGPRLQTELETCNTIKELSSNEIKIVQLSKEDWIKRMISTGAPPVLVEYLVAHQEKGSGDLFRGDLLEEGVTNVKKYSGYEPTSLDDFVRSQNAAKEVR